MTDKDDVVTAIAASLYASRATDDAIRAEPAIEALAREAWDLYHKLERAVRTSSTVTATAVTVIRTRRPAAHPRRVPDSTRQ